MAESSISVAVRVRPFSVKESAQLAPQDNYQPFLGDGGLSTGSPAKGPTSTTSTGTGPSLRTKYLRSIITPVDDKVLIFDPPERNPYGASSSSSSSNTFAHGARKPRDVRYAFDRVFDDTCGQAMVFENTTKPLLDGILNGFNASVFAYGATGCGKTHTISGTPQDPGVIFLTMKELYQRIEESREESDVHVRLSYLEIYNEQIRDLLSPTPTPPGSGLMLREDATNKISIVGITEHTPASPEQVLEMIQEGNQRRTMSPTEANAVSSRSHAVLQINITQRPRTADTVMETTSASLNIIDLAGSERAAATRNDGARMKEGANINKSLLALGNCINALCQSAGQRNRHIPYRNSKLTRLLKFSLGGNCKTVMIVCVSPSSAHYDETHNTLKYANQAKNIRTKVSRNMLNVDRHVAQYVQAIHDLKQEVVELKAKLADRAAIEGAAEKRKKAEMASEVDDCKGRMRKSTDEIILAITHKAGLEALFMAANVRLSSLRQRLQQIDEEVNKESASPVSADVECERQVIRKLIARQEAILNDRTMQVEAQSLANGVQAYRAGLVAAANNTKFDEEATRSVRIIGDGMAAEVEARMARIQSETMSKQLGAGMGLLADFAILGARSTIALKEAANEVEAIQSKQDVKTDIALQLRAVSKMNDDLFARHVGLQTAEASTTNLEQRTNVLQRAARMSVNVQPATISAVMGATGAASGRISKRTSRSSLMPAHSLVSHPLQAPKGASRRPSAAVRRSSIGMRRISSASRRASQSATGGDTSTVASVPVLKKSFRWADETGEGTFDEPKGNNSLRASIGPSGAIRTSLTASATAFPTNVNHALSRSTNDIPGTTLAGNSSAEWEDLSRDAGGHVVEQNDKMRKPLSASLSHNVKPTTSTMTTTTSGGLSNGKKRDGGAMFERNFLRKKTTDEVDVEERSTSSDAMETDDSLDSSFVATLVRDTDDLPTDTLDRTTTTSMTAHNASVRSSPYRRPSHSANTLDADGGTGGVGPIRTKSRSSGGGTMTHDRTNATAARKGASTSSKPMATQNRSTRPSAAQPLRR